VFVVGIVFVVLSVGGAIWRSTHGEPLDFELGTLAGGLIVAAFGSYLYRRESRSTASSNER
jgi:hypothetical protein